MLCPSCQKPLDDGVPKCAYCGFDDAVAFTKFGAVPRYNALVTDTTYAELTQIDKMRIRRHLAHFEKKFPQARLSVFMTSLLPDWKIEEYAFYLLNRCHFQAPANRGGENRVVLMTIDLAKQEACLAASYGIENYLSREDMEEALRKAAPYLARRRYVPAVAAAMRHTAKKLAATLNAQ